MAGFVRLVNKYPLFMKCTQTAVLMSASDVVCQFVIEKHEKLDFVRTAQFAFTGFCLVGPAVSMWYGVLEKFIGSKSPTSALKKMVADQLIFAPTILYVFINFNSALKGNDFKTTQEYIKNNFREIMLTNYKVWPAAQLINFYMMPLNFQVLFNQTIGFFWNIYLSWKVNKNKKKTL